MPIDFSKLPTSQVKGKIDFSKLIPIATKQEPVENPNQKYIDQLEASGKSAADLAKNSWVVTPSASLKGAGKILDLGSNIPAALIDYSTKSTDPTEKYIARTLSEAMSVAIKENKRVGDVLSDKFGNPNKPTYGNAAIYGSAMLKTLADFGGDLNLLPLGKMIKMVKGSSTLAKTMIKEGVGLVEKGVAKEVASTATEKAPSLISEFHGTQKTVDEGFDVVKKAIDYNSMPKPGADQTLFTKITDVFKDVKPLMKKQETIYSQVRKERLGKAMAVGKDVPGLDKVKAMKSQLGGEIDKVEFESVVKKFSQNELNRIVQLVDESPKLAGFEKVNALNGIERIMGERGGSLPRPHELELLERVFPKEVVNAMLESRPFWTKAKELGYEIANVPRAIMSSFDLSAPFRQGLFMSSRKEFWTSLKPMVKSFGSDKAFDAVNDSIVKSANYELMKESGLSLTNLLTSSVAREEKFASQLAEKIPVFGRGIKASGRAYTSFLNKLRVDTFNSLVSNAEKAGLKPLENMELTKEIAHFINAGTGRGNLFKSIEGSQGAAKALNSFFFSPRLMSSRMTLLNPVYYVKADPFVRKEALKSLFALAATATTVNALAKAGGADVTVDPRSADFGKIKIGNTRVDILGGFQQYIRAAAQLATGKTVNSQTGKEYTLGEGYKPQTRLDILAKNIEYKEAPIASFVTALLRGKTSFGEDLNVPREVAMRMVPMITQDLKELYDEDPKLLPLAVASALGFGIQTYKDKSPAERLKEKQGVNAEKFSKENIQKRREEIIRKYTKGK